MERKYKFFFLTFCDSNETFIFMSKFRMEVLPQIKYELVIQRKDGHIFSCHVLKRPKVWKKINFWYSKVQVAKRTETENLQFLGFFCDKQVCGSLSSPADLPFTSSSICKLIGSPAPLEYNDDGKGSRCKVGSSHYWNHVMDSLQA